MQGWASRSDALRHRLILLMSNVTSVAGKEPEMVLEVVPNRYMAGITVAQGERWEYSREQG